MRGEKGRLICVWSPLLQGEGCSTVACTMALALQHRTGGQVLLADRSSSISGISSYIENDIEIRYSIDDLKIFGQGIRAEHVKTYGTRVNNELYMLAGSRLERGKDTEDSEFDRRFLDSCLEGFDLVVADIGAGMSGRKKLYLDRADCIVPVLSPNEVIIDKLLGGALTQETLEYFRGKRTVHIINKLHGSWQVHSVLGRYRSMYGMAAPFGFEYEGDLLKACCMERKLYSYFSRCFRNKSCEYMRQLDTACSFIAGRLSLDEGYEETAVAGGLISKLRRISLF